MYSFIMISLFICEISPTFVTKPKEHNECTDLIEEFSSSISDFTRCSVEHARPVGICENCVDQYIIILDSFDNLTKVSVNDTFCIEKYTNLDRLEIVETIKNNAVDLWAKAKCDDCYISVNETLTDRPSRFKIKFDSYRVNFSACMNWNQNENDTVLCKNCLDTYIKLNNFYFSEGYVGHCMDIVDWMNSTQQYWSEKCCKYRRHDEYVFKFLCTFACLLPLIFYLSARYFGDIKKTTILNQPRFAESLNAQSQSEIAELHSEISG